MRRDPVPEMVWTVMFCLEKKKAAAKIGAKYCQSPFQQNFVLIKPTYPAALQDFTISTKSELGAAL